MITASGMLRPHPGRTLRCVGHVLAAHDPPVEPAVLDEWSGARLEDPAQARPTVGHRVQRNASVAGQLVEELTRNPSDPHSIEDYLSDPDPDPDVAVPIGRALQD